jgi:hypothetical protein
MPYLNIEALTRFVETIRENAANGHRQVTYKLANNQPVAPNERFENLLQGVSMQDVREAYLCLSVLLYTEIDVREELGIKPKRGPKKGSSRRLDKTIHSPEFVIVCDLEAGNITYTEAVNRLVNDFFVSKTIAESFIKERRGAAKNVVAIQEYVLDQIRLKTEKIDTSIINTEITGEI